MLNVWAVGSGGEWETSRLPHLDLCQADSEGPAVMVCSAEMPPEAWPSGQMIDDTSLREQGERLQAPNHYTWTKAPRMDLQPSWAGLKEHGHVYPVQSTQPQSGQQGRLLMASWRLWGPSPFQVPLIFSGSTGPVDSHL